MCTEFGEKRFPYFNWDYKQHPEKYGEFMTYKGDPEHYKHKYESITKKILDKFELISKNHDRRLYKINGSGIVRGLGYQKNPDFFDKILKIAIDNERIFVEYAKRRWYSSTLFWVVHVNISNEHTQAGLIWV